jgi:hypothetical protein
MVFAITGMVFGFPSERCSAWPEFPQPEVSSRYTHIFDVSLWLPCEFGLVFRTEDIAGIEMLVSSSR